MEEKSLNGLRCLALTRCSSKAQGGDGLSNDQQVEILKPFAEEKGMIWVGEERADGVSASSTHKRKDIDGLLHRAETVGDFDVLLVLSYDRLMNGTQKLEPLVIL
jgi:DNA invertase Pin-like site-specific DNA recombinase